mmetsp:Transcript_3316/g.12828  ORF Transcript_3316/g.12828 Transcript_3316/m.12828 type:complete len:252 (-) Transcript_3316:35-790(-)
MPSTRETPLDSCRCRGEGRSGVAAAAFDRSTSTSRARDAGAGDSVTFNIDNPTFDSYRYGDGGGVVVADSSPPLRLVVENRGAVCPLGEFIISFARSRMPTALTLALVFISFILSMNPMILTSERSPLEQTQRVLRKRPELWILPRLRQRLLTVLRRVDRSYYLSQSLASQLFSHARVVGDALQILAMRPRPEFVFGIFLERARRLFPRLVRAFRDRGRGRRAHRFARRLPVRFVARDRAIGRTTRRTLVR